MKLKVKYKIFLVIFLVFFLMTCIYIITKKKPKTNIISSNYFSNPPQSYWFFKTDSEGVINYTKNNVYLSLEIKPNDTYTNAEFYNNPCFNKEIVDKACEKLNDLKYKNMLLDLCKNNTYDICTNIENYKNGLCSLFKSSCSSLQTNNEKDYLMPNNKPFPLFYNAPYLYSKFKTTLKIKNSKGGSRGWGFCDKSDLPNSSTYIIFIQQEGKCTDNSELCFDKDLYILNGFFIMIVTNDKKLTLFRVTDLDENWHDYEIDWKQDKIVFKIDDNVIYTETKNIPSNNLSFHCWVDNAIFSPRTVVQKETENRSIDIKTLDIWN